MAHKMHDEKSDETLRAAFQVFDTSGDGVVNSEEMRRIMLNIGEEASLHDVERAVAQLTRDLEFPKGVIDFDVFRKVVLEDKAL